MSEMIERVARSLALSAGSKMVGGSQSVASREMGWSGGGEYLDKYVEKHWKEHVHAAQFAVSALRKPTEAMIAGVGDLATIHIGQGTYELSKERLRSIFRAMIEVALNV